jgi:hypothetical protein
VCEGRGEWKKGVGRMGEKDVKEGIGAGTVKMDYLGKRGRVGEKVRESGE